MTAAGEVELHALVDGYYDLITIDVANITAEAFNTLITITDGTDTVDVNVSYVLGTPLRIFDGIPMMAAVTAGGSITLSAAGIYPWG